MKDLIVDGQQRCRTIESYIENKDVFALNKISVKKFSELTKEEKENFLNYEVSVRYLKNANNDQITEIFQRINSTEYSLNAVERINAKWGESEFICFTKQLIEEDVDIDFEVINYIINEENRKYSISFFHKKYSVFTENDINRMLALQYVMTLLATLVEEKYFRRNDRVQDYIERYNEDFTKASEIENHFIETLKFIDSLNLELKSYWFNKANLFTLIVELYKFDVDSIDSGKLSSKLISFEDDYRTYIISQLKESEKKSQDAATEPNSKVAQSKNIEIDFSQLIEDSPEVLSEPQNVVETPNISSDEIKYFEFAREAVNEVQAREFRGNMVRSMIEKCLLTT